MFSILRAVLTVLAASIALGARAAPVELSVSTIDGKTFDVADHRGEWIVVNYWATWCGPCIKEMPDLDTLDQARSDVVVLGLAFEETTPEDLKKFLAEHKVGYAISAVDVYAPPKAFAVPKGLPTTHVIDPQGNVAESFIGPVTSADLLRVIGTPAEYQ